MALCAKGAREPVKPASLRAIGPEGARGRDRFGRYGQRGQFWGQALSRAFLTFLTVDSLTDSSWAMSPMVCSLRRRRETPGYLARSSGCTRGRFTPQMHILLLRGCKSAFHTPGNRFNAPTSGEVSGSLRPLARAVGGRGQRALGATGARSSSHNRKGSIRTGVFCLDGYCLSCWRRRSPVKPGMTKIRRSSRRMTIILRPSSADP